MEKFFSVLTAGGIPYVVMSFGTMMLAMGGVNVRFSVLIMIPFALAAAAGVWWTCRRAKVYDLYENMAKLELLAVGFGLSLAAHVAITIYSR